MTMHASRAQAVCFKTHRPESALSLLFQRLNRVIILGGQTLMNFVRTLDYCTSC
jgi:hypothetical protein